MAIKLLRESEQIIQLGGGLKTDYPLLQSDGNFNFKGGTHS